LGKAYRIPSSLDRLRKQQTQIRNLQAANRNRNTPRPVATTAFAGVSAAGSQGGTGNFLRTAGDTMTGPFALGPPVDFSIEIDSDGIIDIGESSSNSQFTSNIQLEDIQPNTFVLDTIAGAAFDGQILVLRTFAPSLPITIAQATLANGGNIQTPNDADFDMGDLQVIALFFDASLIIFDNAPGGTWRVLTGDATGGGGLSEPIELGFNEVTTQTPPTLTIVAGDQFNPSHIDLDQDIKIQLDISATINKYKSIFVIIDTTGGGFTVEWPTSVANPPVIDDSTAQRISVILYTLDNGVLWTNAVSGSSIPGSAEFFGPWTANHDAAGFDLGGLKSVDFFQAGQCITNKADPDGGLLYNVANLQSHIFRADTDEIARFEESAANVFRLDMLDHTVDNAKDYRLDPNASYAIPGPQPGIGFDDTNNRMRINVPTGNQISFEENSAGFGTGVTISPASGGSVTSNIINAANVLQLGVNVTVPTVEGEFRNDGNDTFVFSGGAVRNLSNIGAGSPLTTKGDIFGFDTANARIPVGTDGQVLTADSVEALGVKWADPTGGANTALSNLITTSINEDLIPQAGKSLGDSSNPWSRLTSNKITLETAGTFTVTDNEIIADAATGMEFNTPTGDLFSFFFGGGIASATLSVSQFRMTSGNFRGTGLSLDNAGFSPIINGEFRLNGTDVEVFANNFEIKNTNTGAANTARLTLFKDDASPTNGDEIGSVLFNGASSVQYAEVLAAIGDVSDFGILALRVRADNTGLQTGLQLEGDNNSTLTFLNISARISGNLLPIAGNTIDLGGISNQYNDLWINGIANIGTLTNSITIEATQDIHFSFGNTIDFNANQSSVGSAGSADNVPNRPDSYLIIKANGTEFLVPAFAKP